MAFFIPTGGSIFLQTPWNLTSHLLQGLYAENPLYLPHVGLQEEKAILLRLLLRRLLKRQLYRTFIVFLILESRPAGPGWGECLCVFWMKLLSSNPDGP